jgi:hypothetical protein
MKGGSKPSLPVTAQPSFYKSDDGFGVAGTAGLSGAVVVAGVGATGAVGAGTTGTAGAGGMAFGSTSVAIEGTRMMLLLKFTRTFCPSNEMKRTRVPTFKVTLPN